MVDGFSAAGTQCVMFDSLWPAEWDLQPKTTDPVLSTSKLKIIEVQRVLEASPDIDKFWSIDRVHMTEALAHDDGTRVVYVSGRCEGRTTDKRQAVASTIQ
jgi:hypothetical protein